MAGARALRTSLRDCLVSERLLRQVAPGFYFQRCLPIWGDDLTATLKEGKDRAVAAMDPSAQGGGPRVAGDTELYRALRERFGHTFRILRGMHDGVELTIRNLSPVVTGIGQPHPLENGFAFLKPYGVPYLAGSGVKGAVRAACTRTWEEDRVIGTGGRKERLLHYFGSEEKNLPLGDRNLHARAGLIFFDLLPEVESWEDVFRLDIVNPHYGPYYQGKAAPADWHSPVPSFFLTLRSGLAWRLRILYTPCNTTRQRANWASEIMPGLRATLMLEGLGAKKSWGYGLFAVERADPADSPWSSLVPSPADAQSVLPAGEPGVPLVEPSAGSPSTPEAKAGSESQAEAAAPKRTVQAESVEARIKRLRHQDAKPHLKDIAAQVAQCGPEERAELVELLRGRLGELGFRAKEIRDLFGRYPELGGEER